MTIEDILDENARQKVEIKRLQDILDTNITELFNRTDANSKEIRHNEDSISTLRGRATIMEGNISQNEDVIGQNKLAIGQNNKTIGQHEEAIGQNNKMIGQNKESIEQNEKAIGQDKVSIGQNKESIEQNEKDIGKNEKDIGKNGESIGKLAHINMMLCGYRDNVIHQGTIYYDRLTSESKNSEWPNGGDGKLNLGTGVYTCLTAGYYTITMSGHAGLNPGESATTYLYHNGNKVQESGWESWNASGNDGHIRDQSSRTVILHMSYNDRLEWRADKLQGSSNSPYIRQLTLCLSLTASDH